MKRQSLIILMLLLPLLVNAYNAEIDGIFYNFSEGNAIVTYKTKNYNSYSGSIVIPESITFEGNTYNVTTIGNYAFNGCSGLTTITIPEGVTSIGSSAFNGCSGLTTVNLESNAIVSVTRRSSTSMKTIFGEQVKEYVIGNAVKTIGDYAFSGCSGLTSVFIPDAVTSIGECNQEIKGVTNVEIIPVSA